MCSCTPANRVWQIGNNGAGKRKWFLYRTDATLPLTERYHYTSAGNLVRYATHVTAQKAADRLNENLS